MARKNIFGLKSDYWLILKLIKNKNEEENTENNTCKLPFKENCTQ